MPISKLGQVSWEPYNLHWENCGRLLTQRRCSLVWDVRHKLEFMGKRGQGEPSSEWQQIAKGHELWGKSKSFSKTGSERRREGRDLRSEQGSDQVIKKNFFFLYFILKAMRSLWSIQCREWRDLYFRLLWLWSGEQMGKGMPAGLRSVRVLFESSWWPGFMENWKKQVGQLVVECLLPKLNLHIL